VFKDLPANYTKREFRYSLHLREGILLEQESHFVAETCQNCGPKLFAADPTFSDFDLGIVIQPDFLFMGEPVTSTIKGWYEMPPWRHLSYSRVSTTTVSFTFQTPSGYRESTYLFFEVQVQVETNSPKGMKYRIFIQPNSVEYVQLFFAWVWMDIIDDCNNHHAFYITTFLLAAASLSETR